MPILDPGSRDSSLKGFIRYQEIGPEPGKFFVYDSPEGTVVGYAYAQLGYVSLADDAEVDATRLRTQRFGCDQFIADC